MKPNTVIDGWTQLTLPDDGGQAWPAPNTTAPGLHRGQIAAVTRRQHPEIKSRCSGTLSRSLIRFRLRESHRRRPAALAGSLPRAFSAWPGSGSPVSVR